MTEVRFQPEPTFQAPVKIHVPGEGEKEMRWTYKFRDVDEVAAFHRKWTLPFAETNPGKKKPKANKKEFDSLGYVMDMACGWELDEEFNRANLETFFRNYPTAAKKVVATYFEELAGARLKN